MDISQSKIRVAICGGGITGAMLANLLLRHQDKIEFMVYEGAKKFEEIGTGIGMWGRALNVFKEAGLFDACNKVAAKPDLNDPDFVFNRRVADEGPVGVDFGSWRVAGGSATFHRATLLNILVTNIPNDRVHFNKRLASYETSSGLGLEEIVLHFTDGTSATADVLVGCDGIKSAVRRQMYTSFAKEVGKNLEEYLDKYIEPAWSGSTARRSLISAEALRKINPNHSVFKAPQQYFALDRHLIVMLINEKIINMVAFISDYSKEGTQYSEGNWVKEASQDELFAAYKDFEEEAQQLFRLMPKSMLWAIHSLKEPLPTFVSERVVLMGDAAHAMTPHLGIGAGMGIEDASVLTHFLTSPNITRPNVVLALKAYDTARAQKTGEILRRAQNQGKAYNFRLEDIGRDLDRTKQWIDDNTRAIIAWEVKEDIRVGLEWIEEQSQTDSIK